MYDPLNFSNEKTKTKKRELDHDEFEPLTSCFESFVNLYVLSKLVEAVNIYSQTFQEFFFGGGCLATTIKIILYVVVV